MTTRAEDRVEIRVPRAIASQWSEAASLSGKKRSAFIRDATTQEAERIVAEAKRIRLSADEAHRFIQALEQPAAPNDRLLDAAKRLDDLGLK